MDKAIGLSTSLPALPRNNHCLDEQNNDNYDHDSHRSCKSTICWLLSEHFAYISPFKAFYRHGTMYVLFLIPHFLAEGLRKDWLSRWPRSWLEEPGFWPRQSGCPMYHHDPHVAGDQYIRPLNIYASMINIHEIYLYTLYSIWFDNICGFFLDFSCCEPCRNEQSHAFSLVHVLLCGKHVHVCSCPTLGDPMDSSPPGTSVHGILQARTLEWVAISFLVASYLPRLLMHVSWVSCIGRWVLWPLECPKVVESICSHVNTE